MRKDVQKYVPGTAPTNLLEWGYTSGVPAEQVLEQAVEDGDLSRQGILKAIAELKTVTFDGITTGGTAIRRTGFRLPQRDF